MPVDAFFRSALRRVQLRLLLKRKKDFSYLPKFMTSFTSCLNQMRKTRLAMDRFFVKGFQGKRHRTATLQNVFEKLDLIRRFASSAHTSPVCCSLGYHS